MELWFVGAAAAAGYVAKHWQNLSRDTDGSSELSSDNQRCLLRTSTHKRKQGEDNSNDPNSSLDGRCSAMYKWTTTSEGEGASTSGCGNFNIYENLNELSPMSSLMKLPADGKRSVHDGRSGLADDMHYVSRAGSLREMELFHGSGRNKISLRTKYSHFLKPLTSQESCLMAQLYNEHVKMEEYVLGTCQSPHANMRPLLVIDGSQVISRSSVSYSHLQYGNEDQMLHKKETVYGVPPLQKIRNKDLYKKIYKPGKGQKERLTDSDRVGGGKNFFSKHGPHNGMILFCLGVSVGLLSSLMASRMAVDKLKGLLKQSENLVQDLQEELEMNDSLTVKELVNGNYESNDTLGSSSENQVSQLLLRTRDLGNSLSNDGKDSMHEKAEERSELMSNIEAELEAELERLGLNVSTYNGERKLSEFIEIDQDYEADFARGELRVDMVAAKNVAESKSNVEATDFTTTHSCNYAVSPQELSLRLHEVIQSRLEERVKELEIALENSQRKMHRSRSENINFKRNWSSYELRYSTDDEIPDSEGECNSMSQPLVMSLSGEALDAYNEACEELTKINDSEEEVSSCGIPETTHQMSLYSLDHHSPRYLNPKELQSREKLPGETNYSLLNLSEERTPRIQEILYDDLGKDETSESDGEMEKQLIIQIVEKTKKGSPAVLNAQRLLFSLDNE